MKNTLFILAITLFITSSCNLLFAQDKSTTSKDTDQLFGSGIYLGVGGGYGFNSGLWADFPYSGLTGKAGYRWKLKGSNHSTYNLGVQVTVISISRNKNLGQTNEFFSSWLGIAGFGLSNMFRAKNNFGFEVNINLVPHIQTSSEKGKRYIGPMVNLELRMRYKQFYLGIDSGISINIGPPNFIIGGYTGMKIGANIFLEK